MGRGRKKLDAHTLALLGRITKIDDATFLFFFRDRIGEGNLGPHLQRLIQIEQPAVGVDDDGLTVLAELAPLHIPAAGVHGNAREDAGAAALVIGLEGGHDRSVQQLPGRVNELCQARCAIRKGRIPLAATARASL